MPTIFVAVGTLPPSLVELPADVVALPTLRIHRMRQHSRGMLCPSDANSCPHPRNRGRRESRVPTAPAVSCAKRTVVGAHEHTGSAETARPSPRNGFTAYFVLSPVSGLFCHRHLAKNFPQGLAPASRRQDHTTSPYALAFSSGAKNTPDAKASIASPAQRIVTIAKRPSCGPGWAKQMPLICPTWKAKYF